MSAEFIETVSSLTGGDKVKIKSNKPFVMEEIIPYPTSHTIYGIVTDPNAGTGGIRMFQMREIELDVIDSSLRADITIDKAEGGDLDGTSLGTLINQIRPPAGGGGGVRKRIKKRRPSKKKRRTKRR